MCRHSIRIEESVSTRSEAVWHLVQLPDRVGKGLEVSHREFKDLGKVQGGVSTPTYDHIIIARARFEKENKGLGTKLSGTKASLAVVDPHHGTGLEELS